MRIVWSLRSSKADVSFQDLISGGIQIGSSLLQIEHFDLGSP